MRTVVIFFAGALALAACGGEPAPETPAEPAPAASTTPDPTMLPTPQQDVSAAAMHVTCGGQPYVVAFTDAAATLTYDDGVALELPALAPTADSEPGVTVFTDGKVSIAKSGGGDTPTVIRFARARMAWEDCAIAVN
ncbi:MAG: hypothetical protein R3C46_14785 [Hyphomonadaceae bacterium]